VTTEVVRLRQTVRRLQAESEIARRLARFSDSGPKRCRIYRFIAKESENFATAALCRVCGVSSSAYYAWLKKGEGPTESLVEEAYLANRIYEVWRKSRRRYGVPRVTAALWRKGEHASEKKVARLMAELSIAGISGRRKVRTTRRDPNHELASDLVERDFTADEPDELWLTDVTYIATDEGWLYLCSILDVFSRRFVGWSLQDHLRTELCLDALDAAAMVRGKHCFFGTVLHSDHGCQYTAENFKKRCEQLGIVQSMGTVGDCLLTGQYSSCSSGWRVGSGDNKK
jgi:putative transposase